MVGQGKPAEKVAEEAAESILRDLGFGGCTDEYLQVFSGFTLTGRDCTANLFPHRTGPADHLHGIGKGNFQNQNRPTDTPYRNLHLLHTTPDWGECNASFFLGTITDVLIERRLTGELQGDQGRRCTKCILHTV